MLPNKYLRTLLGAVFSFLLLSGCAQQLETGFAGGQGTQEDPFLVSTATELDGVRDYADRHFIQTADIDLTDYSAAEGWEPIGSRVNGGFSGSFDGNGYKITHLKIDRPESRFVGLFGYSLDTAKFKNITLEGVDVKGRKDTGALVGSNRGDVFNCHVRGSVAGEFYVGGLIGWNRGEVTASHAGGQVDGDSHAGGLIGRSRGDIQDSRATAAVTGTGYHVGGLAGSLGGEIKRSHSTGDVRGLDFVGGLVGENERGTIALSFASGDVAGENFVGGLVGWDRIGTVTKSYATGNVEGISEVGGLVGWNEVAGQVIESYATGHVTGRARVSGMVGNNRGVIRRSYYDKETSGHDHDNRGRPVTTEEMMQRGTFEEWDFTDTWTVEEGRSYPRLRWQQ